MKSTTSASRTGIWILLAVMMSPIAILLAIAYCNPKLPDESVEGMSKQEIVDQYGGPENVSFTAWMPPVVFAFDENRNLVNIAPSETWMPLPDDEPTMPMDFEAFEHATSEEQHLMLMDLVRNSDQGKLPEMLKSLEDVEAQFPKVEVSELWKYYATFLQMGCDLSFDKNGICTNAAEQVF